LRHLDSQVGSAVEHGQQNAFNLEMWIHIPADNTHGVHQVTEALQGVILSLQGYQQGICSAQGVEGQKLQGRGTIDENVVVVFPYTVQGVAQQKLPVCQLDHFHAAAGQGLAAGQHVAVRRGDDGFGGVHAVDEDIIYAVGGGLVHAHAGSGVGLGVKIAQKHALSQIF